MSNKKPWVELLELGVLLVIFGQIQKQIQFYYSWLTFLALACKLIHLAIPVGKHANFVKIIPWLKFLILPISTPKLTLMLLDL